MVVVKCDCGSYAAGEHAQVPYIETAAVHNTERGEVVVFAVNRDLENALPLRVELENASLIEHIVVTGENVTDINTADEEKVFPRRARRKTAFPFFRRSPGT